MSKFKVGDRVRCIDSGGTTVVFNGTHVSGAPVSYHRAAKQQGQA